MGYFDYGSIAGKIRPGNPEALKRMYLVVAGFVRENLAEGHSPDLVRAYWTAFVDAGAAVKLQAVEDVLRFAPDGVPDLDRAADTAVKEAIEAFPVEAPGIEPTPLQ